MLNRLEPIALLCCLLCVSSYGLSVHFPQFVHHRRNKALLHAIKRGQDGNPCPADKPFLCKSTPVKCISLSYVCDGNFDCEDDGFDENPQVCNAANRPPVEELWQFLDMEHEWILPKLFDGIDAEFVAHTLAVSPGLDDVALQMGLSDKAITNIKTAFTAVETGDERPLLKMGMPQNSWHETDFLLNKLLKSGFKVDLD